MFDFKLLRLWVRQNERLCLIFLLILGIVSRFYLAQNCPREWGYAWDEYHEGISLLYEGGELAESPDCWQCYHPPFFYYAGLPFYAAAYNYYSGARWPSLFAPVKFINVLSLLSVALALIYIYRIFRLFNFRGVYLVLGFGLALIFPALYIASWSVEADVLLTTIVVMLLYYLMRYYLRLEPATWLQILVLGVLCGLAVGTKYNGLTALVATGSIVLFRGIRQRRFGIMFRDGLIILALAVAIGGWKYYDNYQKYGTPLFANGTAAAGFSVEKKYHWDQYEFFSLRLGSLIDSMDPEKESRDLTHLEVYRSVPTSLHALAWSDMGIFSISDRHGANWDMYPTRDIPVWMPATVLVLAVVPSLLALLGMFVSSHRKMILPMTILTVVTMGAYFQWFLSQDSWALKTKYILYLLPAYLVWMLLGLKWAERKFPPLVSQILWFMLWSLLILTHIYMFQFSYARVR